MFWHDVTSDFSAVPQAAMNQMSHTRQQQKHLQLRGKNNNRLPKPPFSLRLILPSALSLGNVCWVWRQQVEGLKENVQRQQNAGRISKLQPQACNHSLNAVKVWRPIISETLWNPKSWCFQPRHAFEKGAIVVCSGLHSPSLKQYLSHAQYYQHHNPLCRFNGRGGFFSFQSCDMMTTQTETDVPGFPTKLRDVSDTHVQISLWILLCWPPMQ